MSKKKIPDWVPMGQYIEVATKALSGLLANPDPNVLEESVEDHVHDSLRYADEFYRQLGAKLMLAPAREDA